MLNENMQISKYATNLMNVVCEGMLASVNSVNMFCSHFSKLWRCCRCHGPKFPAVLSFPH